MRTPIVVIAGPTAAGKSAAAMELATRFGGEIVSADSVQIYRGFDVGSAKPGPEERARVRHHIIDALDPDEPIDAMGYAELADRAIQAIQAHGRIPFVVGGTGLWLRALLRGLVALPPPDPRIRGRLEQQADEQGEEALHDHLTQVDPRVAAQVHRRDRVRIIRALEVLEQTGVPLGEHQAQHGLGAPRYPALFIVIDLPREALLSRIRDRTRRMIDAGWADEVRRLKSRWGPRVRPFRSVGYRQMLAHVEGDVPLEETERQIVKATRLYARRQRTWFRGEPGVDWWTTSEELLSDAGARRVVDHSRAGV